MKRAKKPARKPARKRPARRPKATRAPSKGAPALDLQMTRSGSQTIALAKTETITFTFPDREPVELLCSQIWSM